MGERRDGLLWLLVGAALLLAALVVAWLGVSGHLP